MFGSLKKRLSDAVKRVSEKVREEKEAPQPEPVSEEAVEPAKGIKEEVKPEIEKPAKETGKELAKEEIKEPGEKKDLLKGLLKKVKEKRLSEGEVDKFLEELQLALLENDVALPVAEIICRDVKKDLLGMTVKRSEVEKVIKDSLRNAMLDVMAQERKDIRKLIEDKYSASKEPFLIILFGFNGTGKTTTMAKLANKLKDCKPVLAAGDTFRAASIEQLEEHAKRLGLEVVKHKYGADSAAVIFDAVKHAKASGSKLVLADTAGRSHSNVNLMDELKKVVRVNNPDMKILVLDSITGNDVYEQSELFSKSVGVDAVILTKADVYEKGGACLSASHTISKPILYLGVGQEYADLKEFVPEEIVDNLIC